MYFLLWLQFSLLWLILYREKIFSVRNMFKDLIKKKDHALHVLYNYRIVGRKMWVVSLMTKRTHPEVTVIVIVCRHRITKK